MKKVNLILIIIGCITIGAVIMFLIKEDQENGRRANEALNNLMEKNEKNSQKLNDLIDSIENNN